MPLSLRLKWKLERIGAQTHFERGAPCTKDGGCVSERFWAAILSTQERGKAHAVHRSFVTAEELRQSVRIKKVAGGTRNGLESEGGHLPTIWPKLRCPRPPSPRRMERTPRRRRTDRTVAPSPPVEQRYITRALSRNIGRNTHSVGKEKDRGSRNR